VSTGQTRIKAEKKPRISVGGQIKHGYVGEEELAALKDAVRYRFKAHAPHPVSWSTAQDFNLQVEKSYQDLQAQKKLKLGEHVRSAWGHHSASWADGL
jgi:hypothetical protein